MTFSYHWGLVLEKAFFLAKLWLLGRNPY